MIEENGIYKISCKVNGVPMKFVFDTGASDVVISKTEATFLIKQGLINQNDILNKTKYQIANGNIEEGLQINLKSIEIDGIILKNILATVINNDKAPLLLGQSALQKLGKISIEGNMLIIEENNSNYNISKIDELRKETLKYYNDFFTIINKNAKDFKTIFRIEDNNLIIIFSHKDINIDDNNWSEIDKKFDNSSIQNSKEFANYIITNFLCANDEKINLLILNNFNKLEFRYQYRLSTSEYYPTPILMNLKDFISLPKPFTEIELMKILYY
jgi:clan AA aspartic protease (TIGR02281 family)